MYINEYSTVTIEDKLFFDTVGEKASKGAEI